MSTRWRAPKPGTCRVCGCTDDNACEQGCWWVDEEHTLCSSCGGTPADLAYALKDIARLRGKYRRPGLIVAIAVSLANDAVKRFDARGRRKV